MTSITDAELAINQPLEAETRGVKRPAEEPASEPTPVKKARVYKTSAAAKAMAVSGKKIEPPKSGAKVRDTSLPMINGLVLQQKDCKNPDMTGLKVLVTDSRGDAQKMSKMPGAAWFDVDTGVNIIPYTVNGKKGTEVEEEMKHNVFYEGKPGTAIRDGMEIDIWIYAKGGEDRAKKGIPSRFYQYQKITLNSVSQSVKYVEGQLLAMQGLTKRNDLKFTLPIEHNSTEELSFAKSETATDGEATDSESSASTDQPAETTDKAKTDNKDKISFFLSCESISVDFS